MIYGLWVCRWGEQFRSDSLAEPVLHSTLYWALFQKQSELKCAEQTVKLGLKSSGTKKPPKQFQP